MTPEDEYFARRAGEIERERERRDAELEERAQTKPTSTAASDEETGGRASKIIGALSNTMKALFGIRGNRRPRRSPT